MLNQANEVSASMPRITPDEVARRVQQSVLRKLSEYPNLSRVSTDILLATFEHQVSLALFEVSLSELFTGVGKPRAGHAIAYRVVGARQRGDIPQLALSRILTDDEDETRDQHLGAFRFVEHPRVLITSGRTRFMKCGPHMPRRRLRQSLRHTIGRRVVTITYGFFMSGDVFVELDMEVMI